jgi:Flp pilus assembly protein TadB
VQVYRLVAKGTIEEMKYLRQVYKDQVLLASPLCCLLFLTPCLLACFAALLCCLLFLTPFFLYFPAIVATQHNKTQHNTTQHNTTHTERQADSEQPQEGRQGRGQGAERGRAQERGGGLRGVHAVRRKRSPLLLLFLLLFLFLFLFLLLLLLLLLLLSLPCSCSVIAY